MDQAPLKGSGAAGLARRIPLRQLSQIVRRGGTGKPQDPFWFSRYLYRPISIYITWAAVRIGIEPVAVTLTGALCLLAAAICYGSAWPTLWLMGAGLLFMFIVLDHVDGEVARFERWRLHEQRDGRKEFYDTCCHAGEIAVFAAVMMRQFVLLDGPMWLLAAAVLFLFPGGIAPWQRYCETLIKLRAETPGFARVELPTEYLKPDSLSDLERDPAKARRLPAHKFALILLLRTVGFSGNRHLLMLATVADVAAAPKVGLNGQEIPYLAIWAVVTSLHAAAAGIKSTFLYGQRFQQLAASSEREAEGPS